jgi:hypothetical protein
MSFNDRTNKNGTINYQTPQSLGASIQYLKKDETSVEDHPYLEYGEAPLDRGRPTKKTTNTDDAILAALDLAREGHTDEALEAIKHSNTRDYLLFKNQINETLLGEKKNKQWAAPNMNKDNVTLSKSQKQVWDLIQQPPKARRIIWVTGDYGSGKSYLKNYIENNYEYGTYDAGQSASLDNVAYGYNKEGAILWDLPRTYNFNELGDAIANVIEKFSDFGTKISSKKYNGKTTQVLGHTIVFSNHDPIDQLKHRDIIHINLKKEVAPATYTAPIFNLEIRPNKQINQDSDAEEDNEPTIGVFLTSNKYISKITQNHKSIYKVLYKELPTTATVTKSFNAFDEALVFLQSKSIPYL